MAERNNFMGSSLDGLNREDFETDEEYLTAAADIEVKRSSPEFRKAYMKMAGEFEEKQAAKREREHQAAIKTEISKTTLDEFEEKVIRDKAGKDVKYAVTMGEMDPSDIGDEMERIRLTYREKAIKEKASRTVANRGLREAFGYRGQNEVK